MGGAFAFFFSERITFEYKKSDTKKNKVERHKVW
jgi:hypothetical protein